MTQRVMKFNQEFLDADLSELNTDSENLSCNFGAYSEYLREFDAVSDVLNAGGPFLDGHIPVICFLSSAVKGSANTPPSEPKEEHNAGEHENCSHAKYYHCNNIQDSDETAKNNKRMAVVNPNTAENPTKSKSYLYLRSPCITPDYISSVAQTFNKMTYCFGLSPRETKNLFSIIHHESQFRPNARSPTDARCAGQLTKDTVVTTSRRIILEGDSQDNPIPRIYDEAIENCPSLVQKTIPSDIRCTKEYKDSGGNSKPCPHRNLQSRGSSESVESALQEYPITCKLTTDLPQCFFYSFLYFKSLLKLTDRRLEPSKLTVEGNTIISRGDIESFKYFTIQLSYNGGDSISRVQIDSFFDFFKQRIERTNCSSTQSRYCAYKEKILRGASLDLSVIKKEFTDYLKKVPRSLKTGALIYTRPEMYAYPDNITGGKGMGYFQNEDGLARKDLQTIALRRSTAGAAEGELAERIRNTVGEIQKQCRISIP